jgi:phosphoribosylformylglycinamidine (FGAM) synthase PurS component
VPKFKLLASREIFYEFEVDSDSSENAEILVKEIALNENIEKYAYDWAPLEIFDNERSQ